MLAARGDGGVGCRATHARSAEERERSARGARGRRRRPRHILSSPSQRAHTCRPPRPPPVWSPAQPLARTQHWLRTRRPCWPPWKPCWKRMTWHRWCVGEGGMLLLLLLPSVSRRDISAGAWRAPDPKEEKARPRSRAPARPSHPPPLSLPPLHLPITTKRSAWRLTTGPSSRPRPGPPETLARQPSHPPPAPVAAAGGRPAQRPAWARPVRRPARGLAARPLPAAASARPARPAPSVAPASPVD